MPVRRDAAALPRPVFRADPLATRIPPLDTSHRRNPFNSLTFRNNMDIMALRFIGPLRFAAHPT